MVDVYERINERDRDIVSFYLMIFLSIVALTLTLGLIRLWFG